jgi:hypothetical protein
MVDVVRGALAEVETYTRVQLLPIEAASLAGRAVGDIVHLLAELIENALSFSPPQTGVSVRGAVVANGYAVEIEDRGLGMSAPDRAVANENLRFPPEFRLTSTARLGLYVVATLATRYGIRVHLRESPYGGTTAIVLLPMRLINGMPDTAPSTDAAQPSERAELPEPPSGGEAGDLRIGELISSGRSGAVNEAVGGTDTELARYRSAEVRRIETGDTVSLRGTVGPDQLPPVQPDPPLFERLLQGVATPALPEGIWTPPPPRSATASGDGMILPPTAPTTYTASGLPVRHRPDRHTRGSEAPAGGVRPTADGDAGAPDLDRDTRAHKSGRSPEDVRRMVAAHQSGTRRGRSDVERAAGNGQRGASTTAPYAGADDLRPPQTGTDARDDERGPDAGGSPP